jgi:hypothetical protein
LKSRSGQWCSPVSHSERLGPFCSSLSSLPTSAAVHSLLQPDPPSPLTHRNDSTDVAPALSSPSRTLPASKPAPALSSRCCCATHDNNPAV